MDAKYGLHKIKKVNDVITKADLITSFKQLGIKKGMLLYVQSHLENVAYVNGGSQTIIEALQEVVGLEGTIVTSSFSESVIDPACQKEYQFERDIYDEIRETLPVFHKKKTPSEVGVLANQMMRNDAIFRSNHPIKSFVAWGKYAKLICDKHPLHFPLGKESPLDKVLQMNGFILLLGVPCRFADIFQYAATCHGHRPVKVINTPIDRKGNKVFIPYLDNVNSHEEMNGIQDMMEERHVIKECFIAGGHCRFFLAKEANTLAQAYFAHHETI